ncbi:MAG: ABC transporter permease [Oscillospiraceae bacterium]|nr:ABC transporter permease [Oscillospiraceae bacterium]
MSFSQKLAGKYIVSQKRHSVFTILSITAAVLFITVILILFASFWDTMKNANRERFPWHATIYNISAEEAEILRSSEFVAEVEYITFQSTSGEMQSDTNVLFTPDIHDPATLIRNLLCTPEMEMNGEPPPAFLINQQLLDFELIGIKAKANFVTVFSVLYIFIFIFIICARFIIDTAFEISSKEREMQFGILASLGASRKQIVRIILWEGIILSLVAIPTGILLGTGISYIIFDSVISTDILLSFLEVERTAAVFSAPFVYMAAAAVTALIWVMLSAYGTGMRFAKKPPVEVIRRSGEKIDKVKKSRILGKLGGIVGTLASRNVRRNKKRFVITVVSITLSFALTVIMTSVIDYTDDVVKYYQDSDEYISPRYHYLAEYRPNGNADKSIFDMKFTLEDMKKGYELLEASGCMVQMNSFLSCRVDNNDLALHSEIADYYEAQGFAELDIKYYNEDYYNYIFSGEPPVPYSELRGGNYVVCNNSEYSDCLPGECVVDYKTDGSFSGTFTRYVTEDTLRPDDDAELIEHFSDETGRKFYWVSGEIKGNIVANGTRLNGGSDAYTGIELIGCEEDFFDIAKEDSRNLCYGEYYMILNEAQLRDVERTDRAVNEYVSGLEDVVIWMDNVDMLINTQRFNRAFTVLSVAIIILITVIALINEVNIISTGILNRRREIASLRALGMTKGQLTGMTLIECGSYSVISAIATLLICEPLALFINTKFVTGQEAGAPQFSYSTPVFAVLLILIPIFVAGVAATFASLSGFGKNSISEEMRAIE